MHAITRCNWCSFAKEDINYSLALLINWYHIQMAQVSYICGIFSQFFILVLIWKQLKIGCMVGLSHALNICLWLSSCMVSAQCNLTHQTHKGFYMSHCLLSMQAMSLHAHWGHYIYLVSAHCRSVINANGVTFLN